jgi:hypothetical protein
VGLPAEELVVYTPANEFFSVCQSRLPVEPGSESLPDQRARSSMVSACTFMDLLEYFSAFLHVHALCEYA